MASRDRLASEMTWKGSTTWAARWQHHAVNGRVGGRHVERSVFDALFPSLGLFVQPARHIGVFAGREDLDDLVVLHVGHRGGVVGVLRAELDEGGLVEADGRGAVQPLAVGLEQRFAVDVHGVTDGVPITGQLSRHFFDRAPGAHLLGGPLGRPGGQQRVLGRDAVVAQYPGPLGTPRVHAAHAVLLPPEAHGGAIDGQVDVGHDRTLLDLGQPRTARAAHRIPDQLFDGQLDVGPTAFVVQDHHVFEADEGSEYLAMVAKNEGAS